MRRSTGGPEDPMFGEPVQLGVFTEKPVEVEGSLGIFGRIVEQEAGRENGDR